MFQPATDVSEHEAHALTAAIARIERLEERVKKLESELAVQQNWNDETDAEIGSLYDKVYRE